MICAHAFGCQPPPMNHTGPALAQLPLSPRRGHSTQSAQRQDMRQLAPIRETLTFDCMLMSVRWVPGMLMQPSAGAHCMHSWGRGWRAAHVKGLALQGSGQAGQGVRARRRIGTVPPARARPPRPAKAPPAPQRLPRLQHRGGAVVRHAVHCAGPGPGASASAVPHTHAAQDLLLTEHASAKCSACCKGC